MLHRFLTLTGLFDSKEKINLAIENNEITINNEAITNPKYQFNPNTRKVCWKNKEIKHDKKKYYIVFHKPTGYLATKLSKENIEQKKISMFDLIKLDKKILNQLSAVGRLDEPSSGLILLTNDGKINFKITSPKSEIKKTYDVILEKSISDNEIKKAESGVIIDLEVNRKHVDYKTKPAKIKKLSEKNILITITEGKKRQVRRIFESLGNKVVKLKRISIGNLMLDDLEIEDGEFVFVSREIIDEKILD